MSMIPFPANSAEFEEYNAAMNAMADEANACTPDPEPESFGGRCEDAPCCGCCGNDSHEDMDSDNDYLYNAPDDSYLDEDQDDYENYEEGGEDRYLDSYWEDQNEYGMEGCCGDF